MYTDMTIRVVIRIKGGVPEVVAADSKDLHVFYLDEDLDGVGEVDAVEVRDGLETIMAVLTCQQTEEMRFQNPDFIDQVEAIHDAQNLYAEDWQQYLCRTCRKVVLDEEQPGAGDWYDGMCPECADATEPTTDDAAEVE